MKCITQFLESHMYPKENMPHHRYVVGSGNLNQRGLLFITEKVMTILPTNLSRSLK